MLKLYSMKGVAHYFSGGDSSELSISRGLGREGVLLEMSVYHRSINHGQVANLSDSPASKLKSFLFL
jgi:hypothetical protein